jgi:CubicO group peptidase (beta-lactamase class C family)
MVKMVTASAVMQLQEQALIDLDAPVSDYLDYFPAEYTITVRQLLNHSAGLPEANLAHRLFVLDGEPLVDPNLAARSYVEEISGPIFEPGSASAYSNPHIMLVGQIVAEVSGQPYTEYVREHILAPLGMGNTDFSYSSEAMIARAAAHAVPAPQVDGILTSIGEVWELGDPADLFRETDDRYAWMNRINILAAYGGLKGPVIEALRFAQMHLNRGELDGVRILSPESVEMMQEINPSTTGEPLSFTLGWLVSDDPEHPYVEHAGGGVGIRDLMRLYPRDAVSIVLMSNAAGYDDVAVVNAAANVVFEMLGQ